MSAVPARSTSDAPSRIAVVPVRAGALPAGGAEAVAEAGGRVVLVGEGATDAAASLAGVAHAREHALAVVVTDPVARKKYLWWGRYLTQMQMLQFVLNMVQAAYCLTFDSPYPRFLTTLLLYYMMTLLALFAQFYLRKWGGGGAAQVKPASSKKKQ